MKIIVDNILTNYTERGKGKLILILHGWTGEGGKSLEKLAQDLSQQYRVITPDLPGFGQSALPPKNWGVPEYGMFIQNFTKKLGIQPEYVLAHSNGGTLALYALSQNLLEPHKLILLASAGIREKARMKKSLLKAAAQPVKLALAALPRSAQSTIKKRVYGKLGSDLYVMEHMQPIFKKIVDYDIQSAAAKVSQPTLLVYGLDDTSTPVSYGETLARIMPHARLETVPAAGHYVHIDQPEHTTKLIKKFLA